jgi:hypothetical protein
VTYLVTGLVLWLALMAAMFAAQGWHGALTQMVWFFTKAALLTFGGAFEWLSLLIGAAAFVALWRFKVGVIPVIGACAAAGLLRALM